MNKATWLALALAAGACGKSEDKGSATGAASTKEAPAAKAEPAKNKPASELFTSATPAPPPPLDKVTLGMTKAEATTASPDLMGAKYDYKVPGFDGVEMKAHVSDKTDRVYATTVELPDPLETAKGYLEKKWGAPRATKNSIDAAIYYWDHPATGVRAKLEGRASKSALTFDRVMSAAQFLGTTKGRLGFEDKLPLLGASKDDVLKAYAGWNAAVKEADANSISISLPPLDTSEYGGFVSARLKDDKVTGYTAQLSFSWDERAKVELLAGVENLFGPGKKGSMYIDHAGPPKVKVDHDGKDQIVIWVADYK